ncbi:MAG: DUF3488 and transglutaminase-like domain-containing protein [Acidimicrobiia bacterium]
MEPRQLPLVVALGALSATLVLAFGRVFESGAYVFALVGAALLPHAIGAVARWRRASDLITWGGSTAGLVLYALLAAPGIGVSNLGARLSGGWHVITNDAVPIPSTPGAVLFAVIIVWVAATVADDLAFRRQVSLGALAPGLMVLIWVAALGVDDGQWLVVGVFGACGSLFLALQHQALLEHRRTRLGPQGLVDAPRLLIAGALVGVIAVTVGVAAAPALPGGDEPLFETSGLGRDQSNDSYRTSIPPLLDVGDKLKQGERQILFTVKAPRADYWRIVALDDYRSIGGGQWTLTAEGDAAVAEGLDESDAQAPLPQEYRIRDLGERWMPAAYEPVSVSQKDVLVVRSSTTLVTLDRTVTGLRYTVVSDAPDPQIAPGDADATTDPVPAELERFTELPDDFPLTVIAKAQRLTDGLVTPYEKASALRDFFRAEGAFVYNPNTDLGDSEDVIARFLEERKGFCVQFASAYATMARAAGIPARVAVGFTPGELVDGVYRVTNLDAHAWPEVWLGESIGWTHAFDPTPPSTDPGGSDLPGEEDAVTPPTTPATSETPDQTGVTTPTVAPPTTPVTGPGSGVTVDPDPTAADDTGNSTSWLLALVLAVVLLVVAPLVIIVGLKAGRRSRRRSRPDPAAAISGAWSEAVDDLADRRLTWPASATPLEVARRVPTVAGAATEEPLRALAHAYGAVQYGAHRPEPEAARDAWRHVDALRGALDASSGVVRRLRARLDPTTLRQRAAAAAQHFPLSAPEAPGRSSPLRRPPPTPRGEARRDSSAQPEPAGWSKPRSPSTND